MQIVMNLNKIQNGEKYPDISIRNQENTAIG